MDYSTADAETQRTEVEAMSEQEKKVEIKEIIGAMLDMDEAQKQFILGYTAGLAAKKAEESKESA